MREMHGARDGGREPSGRPGIERRVLPRFLLDQPRQALTLDELHAEERATVKLGDLVDRHDIGVVQIGGELGFTEKSLSLLVAGHLPGEDHFQGDKPFDRHLPGLVHDAHAAARDLLQDLVLTDPPK